MESLRVDDIPSLRYASGSFSSRQDETVGEAVVSRQQAMDVWVQEIWALQLKHVREVGEVTELVHERELESLSRFTCRMFSRLKPA